MSAFTESKYLIRRSVDVPDAKLEILIQLGGEKGRPKKIWKETIRKVFNYININDYIINNRA